MAPCAKGNSSEQAPAPGPQSSAATTIRIDNRSTLELTIYVLRGSQANRIGNVSGSTTAVLRIPENLLRDGNLMRFQVDRLGVTQRTTYEILVIPGDQVQLIFPS